MRLLLRVVQETLPEVKESMGIVEVAESRVERDKSNRRKTGNKPKISPDSRFGEPISIDAD